MGEHRAKVAVITVAREVMGWRELASQLAVLGVIEVVGCFMALWWDMLLLGGGHVAIALMTATVVTGATYWRVTNMPAENELSAGEMAATIIRTLVAAAAVVAVATVQGGA